MLGRRGARVEYEAVPGRKEEAVGRAKRATERVSSTILSSSAVSDSIKDRTVSWKRSY